MLDATTVNIFYSLLHNLYLCKKKCCQSVFAARFKCQINVKCCNLLSHVKPHNTQRKGRIEQNMDSSAAAVISKQ